MKLMIMAASARKESVNKKVAELAAKHAKDGGCEVDLAQFSEFDLPLYNADMQDESGVPENGQKFAQRMKEADGLIIVSPEYNFSTPGTLKNLIDWVSRISPMPFKGQQIMLMSASPSLVGGNRGLWATRVPLECCGAFVHPNMFCLASAYSAFDDDGQLKDEKMREKLKGSVNEFISLIKKVS